MNSDADKLWEDLVEKLRRKQGFCPLTAKEADSILDETPAEPLSDDRIHAITNSALGKREDDTIVDPPIDWEPEAVREGATDVMCQLHRNEGEKTAETDKRENDLRRRMLGDDESKEIQA